MHISATEGHFLVSNLKGLASFGVEAWKMVGPLENFSYGGI